jgi:hypothetical protein
MDPLSRLLERRVTQARTWCARHQRLEDPFDAWSSLELSPVSEQRRRRLLDAREDALPDADDPFAMVEYVCSRRDNAFNAGHLLHLEPMAPGRIMAYLPYVTLSHGVEEAASDGFLNVDCGPPWDTWLVLLTDQGDLGPELLSWVPGPLVELVDDAIRRNIEECISWYDT